LEEKEETRLAKQDETEISQLQVTDGKDHKQFDEVPVQDDADEKGDDAVKVKHVKRVRLPRVAKPFGDVFENLLKHDLGEINVKTLKTVNESEIEKWLNGCVTSFTI